jgi:hypothetical protein
MSCKCILLLFCSRFQYRSVILNALIPYRLSLSSLIPKRADEASWLCSFCAAHLSPCGRMRQSASLHCKSTSHLHFTNGRYFTDLTVRSPLGCYQSWFCIKALLFSRVPCDCFILRRPTIKVTCSYYTMVLPTQMDHCTSDTF